jgi:tight adherence protein B
MADLGLPTFLAPLLAALAFAGVVFAVAYPYFADDRKGKRVEVVATGRSSRKGSSVVADIQSSRKKSVAETLKEIETREKAKKKITMSLRLMRAGLKKKPRDFYVASALLGVLLASIALFILELPLSAAIVAAFVGGFGLPRWVLNKMTARRQAKFLGQLANAIDVIVRGIKSGLPLNECFQVIARESPEPLGSEFFEVVEQQKMGVGLADGLERMCDRLPLPEVRLRASVTGDEGQGAISGSQGVGARARVSASGRHDDGLPRVSRLHSSAVHDDDGAFHGRFRRRVDAHRRSDHEEDDQLQILDVFTRTGAIVHTWRRLLIRS